MADEHDIPVHIIRKNTAVQINKFLKYFFKAGVAGDEVEDVALREAEEAVEKVVNTKRSVDLSPQNAYIRRLQHKLLDKKGLHSESVGEEPKRRLRIYPG